MIAYKLACVLSGLAFKSLNEVIICLMFPLYKLGTLLTGIVAEILKGSELANLDL
jgi:hypothetical protein